MIIELLNNYEREIVEIQKDRTFFRNKLKACKTFNEAVRATSNYHTQRRLRYYHLEQIHDKVKDTLIGALPMEPYFTIDEFKN